MGKGVVLEVAPTRAQDDRENFLLNTYFRSVKRAEVVNNRSLAKRG